MLENPPAIYIVFAGTQQDPFCHSQQPC